MKQRILVAGMVACVIAATAFIGCATSKPTLETEELLQSCGFKIMAATTPAHKAQLHRLRPGKLTVVHRNGKTWYVYPDPAHHQFYIGNPDQYQAFRQAYQDQQMVQGQVDSALLSGDTAEWDFGGVDFLE